MRGLESYKGESARSRSQGNLTPGCNCWYSGQNHQIQIGIGSIIQVTCVRTRENPPESNHQIEREPTQAVSWGGNGSDAKWFGYEFQHVAVGKFPHSTKKFLGHQLDVLQFNSILILSTWKWHQIPQVKSSVQQTAAYTSFYQKPVTNPGCYFTSNRWAINQKFPWPLTWIWFIY